MYFPTLPLTGWIFDVYPTSGGMVVWIVDAEGKSHRLMDPFQPSFYAAGHVKALRQLAPALHRQLAVPRPGITLYDCDLSPALTYCHAQGIFPLAKVTVSRDTVNGAGEPRAASSQFETFVPSSGRGIRNPKLQYAVEGSAWDLDYPEPPLTLMALASQGDEQGRGAPIGKLRSLTITCEGE